MKTNVGKFDRGLRLSAAALLASLYVVGIIDGPWVIPLGIVAITLMATGLSGSCPTYHLFGIGTCEVKE